MCHHRPWHNLNCTCPPRKIWGSAAGQYPPPLSRWSSCSPDSMGMYKGNLVRRRNRWLVGGHTDKWPRNPLRPHHASSRGHRHTSWPLAGTDEPPSCLDRTWCGWGIGGWWQNQWTTSWTTSLWALARQQDSIHQYINVKWHSVPIAHSFKSVDFCTYF